MEMTKTIKVKPEQFLKLQEAVKASGVYFTNLKKIDSVLRAPDFISLGGTVKNMMDFDRRWITLNSQVTEKKTKGLKKIINKLKGAF